MTEWEMVGKKYKGKAQNGFVVENSRIKESNKHADLKEKENLKKKVTNKPEIKLASMAKDNNLIIQPQTLEEALKMVQIMELQSIVNNEKNTFPNNPIIWIKDLAAFLSKQLEVPQNTTRNYSEFVEGYPLCSFPHKAFLMDFIESCPIMDCELFFHDYLNLVVKKNPPINTLHGYNLILQAVLFQNPKILFENILKLKSLFEAYKSKQPICLSLFWILKQVNIKKYPKEAMQIWSQILLPFITNHNLLGPSISYIQRILKFGHNNQNFVGLMDPVDFIQFFDVVHNLSTPPLNIDPQLEGTYLKLKEIAFSNPSDIVVLFPLFLSRVKIPRKKSLVTTEILDSLNQCLAADSKCFELWKRIYPKYPVQSSILARVIVENYDEILEDHSSIDAKELDKTVNWIIQKAVSDGIYEDNGVKPNAFSSRTTRSLKRKSCNRKKHPFISMFFKSLLLCLLFAFSFLYYDTHRSDPENSYVVKINQKIDELGYRDQIDQIDQYVKTGLDYGTKYYNEAKTYYLKDIDPHVRKHAHVTWKTAQKYYRDTHTASMPYIKRGKSLAIEYYKHSQPYLEQAKILAYQYLLQLQNLANYLIEQANSFDFTVFQHFVQDNYQKLRKTLESYLRAE